MRGNDGYRSYAAARKHDPVCSQTGRGPDMQHRKRRCRPMQQSQAGWAFTRLCPGTQSRARQKARCAGVEKGRNTTSAGGSGGHSCGERVAWLSEVRRLNCEEEELKVHCVRKKMRCLQTVRPNQTSDRLVGERRRRRRHGCSLRHSLVGRGRGVRKH